MIKISRDGYRVLTNALDDMFNSGVAIESVEGLFERREKPIEWGVNWCCKGVVDAFAACDFADALREAAYTAKCLTRFQIIIDDEKASPIRTKEDYLQKKAELKDIIEAGNLTKRAIEAL